MENCRVKIITDSQKAYIVIFENQIEVAWFITENVEVIDYFTSHYKKLGYLIETHTLRRNRNFIPSPLDGKECEWEDVMGNVAIGTYSSTEDSFITEDGKFTFKQYVKTWKYV